MGQAEFCFARNSPGQSFFTIDQAKGKILLEASERPVRAACFWQGRRPRRPQAEVCFLRRQVSSYGATWNIISPRNGLCACSVERIEVRATAFLPFPLRERGVSKGGAAPFGGGFQRGQSPLSVAHIHARNEARLGPLLFAVAPCVALSVVSWSSIARARYRWLITQQRFCERQGFFLEILYFERKNPVFHPVRLLLNGRVPPSFLQGRRPRRPQAEVWQHQVL